MYPTCKAPLSKGRQSIHSNKAISCDNSSKCRVFLGKRWQSWCSAAETRVVVDGQLITSRGPGTAIEFALQLVKALYGEDKAREVAGPMVAHDFQLA